MRIDSLANIDGIGIADVVAAGNDMIIYAKESAYAVQGVSLANNISFSRMAVRPGPAGYLRMAGQSGCITPAQHQRQENQEQD